MKASTKERIGSTWDSWKAEPTRRLLGWFDRIKADRATQVDCAAILTLTVVAGVGFHTAFGGWAFLTPVLVGAVLGTFLGLVWATARPPAIVMAAIVVLVFFGLGAAATVWRDTIFGLPTPDSFDAMVRGVIDGWRELLTVVPPSGLEGNLLVVPFITCYVAAIGCSYLALRTRTIVSPVMFPAGAFATALLWGTDEPAALLLQGIGFLSVSIAWMVHRDGRWRQRMSGTPTSRRWVWAGGVVVAVLVATPVAADSLPFTSRERYVLREKVDPPPDTRLYPSPLSRYPWYTDRSDVPLFSVTLEKPLPEGSMFRLAAMDAYDGQVFAVDASTPNGSGTFVKTGKRFPDAPTGDKRTVTVTLAELTDVWLPVIGEPVAIEPAGPRARELERSLRYNRATRALVLPQRTAPGDSYGLSTVIAPVPTDAELQGAAFDSAVPLQPLPAGATPPWVRTMSQQIIDEAEAESDYEIARAIVDVLANTGGAQDELEATHSIFRLTLFTEAYLGDPEAGFLGTAEQYTATAALLLRSAGVPVRTVVGFAVPTGETQFDVLGADTEAWIEVAFAGRGWVRFDPVPDRPERPTSVQQGEPQQLDNTPPEPPPPAPPPVPEAIPDDDEAEREEEEDEEQDEEEAFTSPRSPWEQAARVAVGVGVSIPVGVLALVVLIGGVKLIRRRRRRSGDPLRRIVGAWSELLDRARDAGRALPHSLTRAEASRVIGSDRASSAALLADAATFGDSAPTAAEAEVMWQHVTASLDELKHGRGPLARLRSLLDVQTFVRRS